MTPCLEWVVPRTGATQMNKELCAVCGATPFEHLSRMLTVCAERLQFLGDAKQGEIDRLNRAVTVTADLGTLYASQKHAQRDAWKQGFMAVGYNATLNDNPYKLDDDPEFGGTAPVSPTACCAHCAHHFEMVHGTPCPECASAARR